MLDKIKFGSVRKRINSIEDEYLDRDLTKEQYNRMLEGYTQDQSSYY